MNQLSKRYKREDEFQIQTIFHDLIRKWHYFLIAGVFFAGLALVYIKLTLPVYQASSSILIDDEKLIAEDNSSKWNQSQFQHIEYTIPDAMIKGKSKVRIKFQALPGNTAGAVYYIRIKKKDWRIQHAELYSVNKKIISSLE